MAFVPLTKAPNFKTKWWISTQKGGVNRCVVVDETTGSVVPNGLGYVWGRYSELLGKGCTLPTIDNSDWYKNVTGAMKGKTPKVGAIAVWAQTNNYGKLFYGIVEEISSSGIKVSCMTYGGPWILRQTNAEYTFNSDYVLQGFVYNPKVVQDNPVERFLEIVNSWKNVNPGAQKWVRKKVNYPSGPWCCAFVWACAKEAGVLGKCIPGTASSTAMMKQGKEVLGGTFIDGPYFTHGPVIPQPGDIFGRHNDKSKSKSHYAMKHVGVVVSVDTKKGVFHTVEGNTTGGRCAGRTYAFNRRDIGGFLRPNWAKVGGSAVAYNQTYTGTKGYTNVSAHEPVNLYDSASTAEDATLRECCYLSDAGELTTRQTGLKVSAINYTSGLMQLIQSTGGYDTNQSLLATNYNPLGSASNTKADASKFTSANAQTIFNYLTSTGMNIAQAIGFLGNIQHESGFSPASVNKGSGASGIVQWLGARKQAMIKYCGVNWKNNLQGQMEFIWKELKGSEKATWSRLKTQITADTLEMAKRAAVIICDEYERPYYKGITAAKKQKERDTRANYAAQLWKKLIITQGTNNNPVSQAATQSGQTGDELPLGNKVLLPEASKQTGLTQSYMNYTYMYKYWKSGSREESIASIWNVKGQQHKRHIAMIDDYYLIVVSPYLGSVGDILTVVLSDGTKFNALICQTKTYDESRWGKLSHGKIDVITWAKCGASNLVNDTTKLDLTGWAGKAITYVINYGTYLK